MATRIGSLITETLHPFGRNTLNTTGQLFGTAVSTGVSTSATVESVRITLPDNAVVVELEAGLTAYFYNTITTGNIRFSWLIKDSGNTSYDLLVDSTTITAAGTTPTSITSPTTPATDPYFWTMLGRPVISSGTYFTGKGSFDILLQSGLGYTPTGDTVVSRTINSSYVQYSYYLIG